MKKILACVVAVAMLLSLMPMTFAAEAADYGIIAEAVKDGDKITVTVSLPAVTALVSCAVSVAFDPAVVSIPLLADYAAEREIEGEMVDYFAGYWEGGFVDGRDDLVVTAFMGTADKYVVTKFAQFVFTIIDDTVKETDFTVTLEKYEDNDATKKLDDEDEGVLIDVLTVGISDGSGDPEETEKPDELPENVQELIRQIKEQLDSVGLGFLEQLPLADEAIVYIARIIGGDLELEEIIEILSRDFEIPGIGSVNLPDLLNQLMDTIMGLFGGGNTDTPTTTKPTTNNGGNGSDDDTDDTTAAVDENNDGNKPLGDAGIALAVSVCLAAGAAFVITKKKENE